ncbi:MAG TPA: hypothetical protein VFN84_01910 [Pseudolabrys sp.]|nr:hypothetical protein [Pseudolabrys sp.]
MRRFNKPLRTFALGALIAVLGGCSEYLDRRDTIALSGGNAVATDVVTQMVDPWPRESASRNIAFNGPKMQSAFERYRTNRVITPHGIGTSAAYQDAQGPNSQNNGAPVGPSVTQPAAPVK